MPDPLQVTFEPLGEEAVVAIFGSSISTELNERACRFADAVARADLGYVSDVVPAFAACTVYYRAVAVPLVGSATPYGTVVRRLQAIAASRAGKGKSTQQSVDIPVCYGGEMGPDMEEAAAFCGLTPDELIEAHSGSSGLRVFMIGFMPGAPYIGMHDARLQIPRRSTPRTIVPAGSVGIANRQTMVYPEAVPGGWNLIGRTPLKLFDPARPSPSLLAPGSLVTFRAISPAEFADLSRDSNVD